MKEIFSINDTLANKISYFHLLAFLFFLPFDRFFSEIALISLLAHTLIHLNKQKLRALPAAVWILSSIFFLTVIGVAYSGDRSQGYKDIEKQLALILFPLCLGLTGLDLAKYRMKLLKAFALTCTLTILYLYAYNLIVIINNKMPLSNIFSNFFFNHNFSAPIELHATYLSMFVTISVVSLLFLHFTERASRQKLFYKISIAILLIGLFQLSSRAVFISTLLILNIVVPLMALKGQQSKRFFLVAASITVMAIIAIFSVDFLKSRFITSLQDDLAAQSETSQVNEPRLVRWKVAVNLISKSPLIGYGSGNEINVLKDAYFKKKLYESYYYELNAHNQFLSFLLKTGAIGLLLYLFVLWFGFVNAWHSKDIIFFSFMILITTVSFSENILDVNKGIFFYSFFSSLFILSQKNITGVPKWLKKREKAGVVQPGVVG